MKKRILLFSAVAALGAFAISSYQTGAARNGYDCTGAEAAGTGSFANPTGCYSAGAGCHNSAATTSIGVTIELDSAGVPTTHYRGGYTYTVKITGTPTGTANTHFGFQLNALKGTVSTSSNADAGTWSSTGLPSGTRRTVPGTYTQLTCMEHSTPQTMAGSSFTEAFTWTAPVSGTGAISFWGAVNFVNNDGNANSADVWNTNHVIINEWSTTAVPNEEKVISIKAFPNPVTSQLHLQISNGTSGSYTVQVFDMFGKTITSETIELNSISQASLNTASWAPGLYQVVVEKDGAREAIPVVK